MTKKKLHTAVETLIQADELARNAIDACKKARENYEKATALRTRLENLLTKDEAKEYFEHKAQFGYM